jgi:hypothetical protein
MKLMRRMKKRTLPLPILGAIAATRGMLGAGIGMLLGPRLPESRRKAVGLALVGIGIASTVPLAWTVIHSR